MHLLKSSRWFDIKQLKNNQSIIIIFFLYKKHTDYLFFNLTHPWHHGYPPSGLRIPEARVFLLLMVSVGQYTLVYINWLSTASIPLVGWLVALFGPLVCHDFLQGQEDTIRYSCRSACLCLVFTCGRCLGATTKKEMVVLGGVPKTLQGSCGENYHFMQFQNWKYFLNNPAKTIEYLYTRFVRLPSMTPGRGKTHKLKSEIVFLWVLKAKTKSAIFFIKIYGQAPKLPNQLYGLSVSV